MFRLFFFFNDTATTEIYTYGHTLSLHDALPISRSLSVVEWSSMVTGFFTGETGGSRTPEHIAAVTVARHAALAMMRLSRVTALSALAAGDRKSTRLNSSH